MKQVLVVHGILGTVIGVVDESPTSSVAIKDMLEDRYNVKVVEMPLCTINPYTQGKELYIPTIDGGCLNITLTRTTYYSR